MKKIFYLLPALMSVALLAGCAVPLAVAGGMYATKPSEPSPADTASQIPQHESWCYSSLGNSVECFSEPQDTPPGRLINVEPQSRYPLTAAAYRQVVEQNRLASLPKEAATAVPSAAATPVQPAEVTPLPPKAAPKASSAPKAATTHKAKKHKKKRKQSAKPNQPAVLPYAPIPN
jgi:hypothetical protein